MYEKTNEIYRLPLICRTRLQPKMRTVVALVFWAVSSACLVDTLSGSVIGVTDGDTNTVLDPQNKQHKIRLPGIDAPEKRQPYNKRSEQHLSPCFTAKT